MPLEITHDLWFCSDCTIFACNGDLSGVDDEERVAAIDAGAQRLGEKYKGHVSPNFDSETGDGIREFWHPLTGCDCCGSRLAGEFHRFAVLGEVAPVEECHASMMYGVCKLPKGHAGKHSRKAKS